MKSAHCLACLFLLFIALPLNGCGSGDAESELSTYALETLPPLRDMLNAALDKYDAVSGDRYSDEASLYESVRLEVLPLLKELLLQSEAFHPRSDRVARLHDGFLAALRRYSSAFQLLLIALDQQNMQNVAVALEELEEARSLRRDYEIRFEDACGAGSDGSIEASTMHQE